MPSVVFAPGRGLPPFRLPGGSADAASARASATAAAASAATVAAATATLAALRSMSTQAANAVAITGGTVDGISYARVVGAALGTTVSSVVDGGEFQVAAGNQVRLRTSLVREVAGSDWTGTRMQIQHRVDGVLQGFVAFNAQGGGSGVSLGAANAVVMHATAAGLTLVNNRGYRWTDASGTIAGLVLQSDNNFVLYGTGSGGDSRSIFDVAMRSDTSRLRFNVRSEIAAGLFATGTSDWTGETNSNSRPTIRADVTHTSTALLSGFPALNWLRLTDTLQSAGYANGFLLEHNFGGGSTSGGRHAQLTTLVMTGATAAANTAGGDFFLAHQFYSIMRGTNGGTSTQIGAGASGHNYGISSWARLESGALNWYENIGYEMNVSTRAGASVGLNTGLQIVLTSDHASQGFHARDAAIYAGNQTGAVPWNDFIKLGAPQGVWPLATGGTIFATRTNPGRPAALAAHGIDFNVVEFSGSAFRSPGFAVGGAGAVNALSLDVRGLNVTRDSGGATISLTERYGTAVAVQAGGTGHNVNDLLSDGMGGIYRVATLTGAAGSGVATLTMLAPPVIASVPGNPVALTSVMDDSFFAVGSGCTVNITWSSATPTLSLGTGLRLPDVSGTIANWIEIAGAVAGSPARISARGQTDREMMLETPGLGPLVFQAGGNGAQFRVLSVVATGIITLQAPQSGTPGLIYGSNSQPIRLFGGGTAETQLGTSGTSGSPVRMLGARVEGSGVVLSPTTGGSLTVPNNCSWQHLTPAGTLATLTVTMPAAPADGQDVVISTTQTITALTLSPNAGQSILAAATTLAANTSVTYRYRTTGTVWTRIA